MGMETKILDRYGRFIPEIVTGEEVFEANSSYHLVQAKIDFAAVHARFVRLLPQHTFVSSGQFWQGSLELAERLRKDARMAPLLNGAHLPVCFPQIDVEDYGATLEGVFFEAVARAYVEAYPDRIFKNWLKGKLAGQVTIVDRTRHDRLLGAMHRGPAVGLWFPTPFQGFSIPADRVVITHLP